MPIFDELREHTYAHVALPQMQVGRVEGSLLRMLAKLIGARRILEIGTFTGFSALCMAEALPDDGVLCTCEISAEVAAVAQRFFDRSPHGNKIQLLVGDALASVGALDDRPFDLAFIDADKERYLDYYEAILPRLRAGGLLVADNVLWSGAVLEPKTPAAFAIAAFNDRVQRDARVENLFLPVRDGVMLARKL
ncbi:MAG: methyltransferase [Myxococcales bacterium]|nr:methyltransferase [Myxococcales bacterium]